VDGGCCVAEPTARSAAQRGWRSAARLAASLGASRSYPCVLTSEAQTEMQAAVAAAA